MFGQQLHQGLLVFQELGHQDFIRHKAVGAVGTCLRKASSSSSVGVVAVAEKIRQAAGDPTAPDQQDDDHGRVALPGQADGILIFKIRGMGDLLGQGAVQQGQPVPQIGRFFKAQVGSRLGHLFGQLPAELLALALQKEQGFLGRSR